MVEEKRLTERQKRSVANRARHKEQRDKMLTKPERKAQAAPAAMVGLFELEEPVDDMQPGDDAERRVIAQLERGLPLVDAALLAGVVPEAYQKLLDDHEVCKLRRLAATSRFQARTLEELKAASGSSFTSQAWLLERTGTRWLSPSDRAKARVSEMSPRSFAAAVHEGLAALAAKHTGVVHSPNHWLGIASASGRPLGSFHRELELAFRQKVVLDEGLGPLEAATRERAKKLTDEFIAEAQQPAKPGEFTHSEIRDLTSKQMLADVESGATRTWMPGDNPDDRRREAERRVRARIDAGELRPERK